jgi:hypothetical protein
MTGSELIAQERVRQIEQEGWTPHHDDEHVHRELAWAANCYLVEAIRPGTSKIFLIPPNWPWSNNWWKPTGAPIRNLVKAGALIAAEIDRLQRAKS